MKRIERILKAWNAQTDDELTEAIAKLTESDLRIALFSAIKTVKQHAQDLGAVGATYSRV